MFSLEIVLVSVLMVSESELSSAYLDQFKPTLYAIALNEELVDPRELARTDSEFISDIYKRQDRFKGFPKLHELDRFPDIQLINDFLSKNACYATCLRQRLAFDLYHEDDIREAIHESAQLYCLYDFLRDAKATTYYVGVRRDSLNSFRELIGAEAFYSGFLPSPIPVRHLPRK